MPRLKESPTVRFPNASKPEGKQENIKLPIGLIKTYAVKPSGRKSARKKSTNSPQSYTMYSFNIYSILHPQLYLNPLLQQDADNVPVREASS